MRGLKYLVILLICFPVMPDVCCMSPIYAGEPATQAATQAETFDSCVRAILFFTCVLVGIRLWKVFISSFEKGSF